MNDQSLFPNHETELSPEPVEEVLLPLSETALSEEFPTQTSDVPLQEVGEPIQSAPVAEASVSEQPIPGAEPPMPEQPRMPLREQRPPVREAPSAPQPPAQGQNPYGNPYMPRPPYPPQPPVQPRGGYRPLQRPQMPGYGDGSRQESGNPYGQNGYAVPPRNPYTNAGNVPPVPPYYGGVPGATPPKKQKRSFNWLLALLIAGCILVGGLSGVLISGLVRDQEAPVSVQEPGTTLRPDTDPIIPPTRETRPLATVSGEQMTLNQIYEKNVSAIVGITSYATETVFGQTTQTGGTGSGFIITSDGEILTNYHVVEGADRLAVTLYDGREFPATLVGYEAESDVALIKIEAEGLPVCAIGNSDQVYVGEQIAAIGNPMGELTYTMTVGYVSAVDRFVNTDGTPISMIQVDAAINPGNSGGPVFNLYGEVIGIASAKYSGIVNGGATLEGLGFAIPINDIVEILNDLRINGRVPDRAYMGVVVSTLPVDKATYGVDHGILIQSVEEGGSAHKAGLQANDVIVAIGDQELKLYEDLQKVLRKYRAGDRTTITVFRGGQTKTLPIVFDAKPEVLPPITEPTQPTQPPLPTEPEESTEETTNPWEGFPWEDFPWEDFPWGNYGG